MLAVVLPLGYVQFQQWRAEARSFCNCESDGLHWWRNVLRRYAEEHGGRLLSPAERASLTPPFGCDTGAPYTWNDAVRRVPAGGVVPLVWCGHPHGFTRRWRNVLFSDFEIRHVPEPPEGSSIPEAVARAR